jgi:hypothetical protein
MARVYLHQLVDIAGTGRADDLHHDATGRAPEVGARRRRRCFGAFDVVGSTGRWPQVLNLWEHDSWADLAHDVSTEVEQVGSGDPPTEAFLATDDLHHGGTGRILVAHPASPGVQDWERRGGTGAVAYVHEVIDGPPGSAGDLCDTAVHDGAEDHRRFGLELVGAWRTALRADDQVVLMWSLPSWEAWATYEEAADGGDVEFFHLWERLSGQVLGRRRLLLVDAELSPLRIGRQPSAADRRSPGG